MDDLQVYQVSRAHWVLKQHGFTLSSSSTQIADAICAHAATDLAERHRFVELTKSEHYCAHLLSRILATDARFAGFTVQVCLSTSALLV